MNKIKTGFFANTDMLYGMTIGSLNAMMVLAIFFGNDKEVLCVLPLVAISVILYDNSKTK